jgi:glycopeptide antibiotics resistance protein
MKRIQVGSGLNYLVFSLYFFIVFYLVFLSGERSFNAGYHEHFFNVTPFRNLWLGPGHLPNDQPLAEFQFYKNLVGNILLFIPFALVVRSCFKIPSAGIFLTGFFSSLLIELIQFVTYLGVADIDDLLLNTLGLLIGIVLLQSISTK